MAVTRCEQCGLSSCDEYEIGMAKRGQPPIAKHTIFLCGACRVITLDQLRHFIRDQGGEVEE